MYGNNAAKRKIQEEIKKRKSKFIALGSVGLALFIPIALFLFVITVFYYLYQSYIGAAVVDDPSIFKDEQLVGMLKGVYEIHDYDTDEDEDLKPDYLYNRETAENNNYFQELKRQHYIWADDYKEFGIIHSANALPSSWVIRNWQNNDDDIDQSKYLALVNYQSYLNLGSYYNNYDDKYDTMIVHDDVMLREYENERVAYNRDVRNFYEQSEERIGSAFFLYPGYRELIGNSVNSVVTFNKVHPAYWCEDDDDYCQLVNLGTILSDWSILGRMFMLGEDDYNSYFDEYQSLGPLRSAQYYVNALSYGYNYCDEEGSEKDEEHELWEQLNVCNDYDLMYSESNGKIYREEGYKYPQLQLLQDALNKNLFLEGEEHLEAELPKYEPNRDNTYFDTNIKTVVHRTKVAEESQRWFITVSVKRNYDDDLYKKYLKTVYIPAIYIDCKGCNRNKTVEGVYSEIQQYEEAFRYFNNQAYNKDIISKTSVRGSSGTVLPANGTSANLPSSLNSQLSMPINGSSPNQTSCFGYYDAMPNTRYYCYVHRGVDLTGGTKILSPADGVVKYCNTAHNSWGPYLEIEHTLKDENGNDVKIISYYMHWLDKNGNLSCANMQAGTSIKVGEIIGTVSNQAGSHSVGTHLHFGLKGSDGTLYNPESYLYSLGLSTDAYNGTTNCDEVRRVCNEYCSTHSCTTA